MSALDSWDSYRPITLLKMGVESPLLAKICINGSVEFLGIPYFSVYPCLLGISWLPMIPQIGEMVVPPIRTGVFPTRGDLTATFPYRGVLTSLPVLLTCPGVRRMRALLHAASVMNSFVVVAVRASGVPPQVATLCIIQVSIVVVMIRRFWLIIFFCVYVASVRNLSFLSITNVST